MPYGLTVLEQQIIAHEGMRLAPYMDTVGRLTIGVGRNLTDKGISYGEAIYLMRQDIDEAVAGLRLHLPWVHSLDAVRQRVLVDMAYNLGIVGLMRFVETLAHVERREYDKAAQEMLHSAWAQQVGSRATRLARMMQTGKA